MYIAIACRVRPLVFLTFTTTFAGVTSDSEGANSAVQGFPRQTLPLKGIAHPGLIRAPLALDRRHRPSRRGADPATGAACGGGSGGGVGQPDGLGAESLQQNCISDILL